MFEVVILLMNCLIKHVFQINESKTLTRHISCNSKCKFNGRKYNSKQKWNNDKYQCNCKNPKNHRVCEKDYIFGILLHVVVKITNISQVLLTIQLLHVMKL